MSLIPTIYKSTDPGAPQLTGQAGSLLALLRAILVSGYGAAPNAKTALGWTEAFTGTNKAVFRNNPVTGSGRFLRVDDSGSIGNARHAWLRGYDSMTDVDTGAAPIPTVGQAANGSLWAKSKTLDGLARVWWAIGNERSFYLFIEAAPAAGQAEIAAPHFAGELISLKPADACAWALSTYPFSAYTGADYQLQNLFAGTGNINNVPAPAMYLARTYTQLGGAVPVGCISTGGGFEWGVSGFPYPYPVNNGLMLSRGYVAEGSWGVRGYMPGLFVPIHAKPFSDRQTLSDLPGLPAGTVLFSKLYNKYVSSQSETFNGQVLFELGAW